MKSNYTFFVIGIAGFIIFVLIIIFGLRLLVVSIANQRTCECANIDNIELNAKIDIPSILDSECDYLKAINTKKAYFQFDLADFDMDRYIEVNKLKKLNSQYPEIDFINFNSDSLSVGAIYYKLRTGDNSNSYVLFDQNKGQLWVSVQYAD